MIFSNLLKLNVKSLLLGAILAAISLPGTLMAQLTTIEDFEQGIAWPWSPWQAPGYTFGTLTTPAHSGNYSYDSQSGWIHRTDVSLGKTNDVLSCWTQIGSGRTYLGFGASASGTYSFVAGNNTNTFLFQNNPSYGYIELTEVPFSFVYGKWYRMEVEFTSPTTVVGRIFDSNGSTLLSSVTLNLPNFQAGGIALRTFGGNKVDLIQTNALAEQHHYYVNDHLTASDIFTTAIGDSANPGTSAAPFATIQHAINQASDGDTVYVDAGSYYGQLEVDKNLTIIGAGQGVTTILGKANMPLFFTTSKDNYPVAYVHDADHVVFKNLTLDGDGQGNYNYRYVGFGYNNAGGRLYEVEVKDIRDTPLSGNQHGVAILADASSGVARNLMVEKSNIHGFQKTAIAFSGANLSANAQSNIISGAGPINITAQNGIQFYGTKGGSLLSNTINDVYYSGPSWTASAILLYQNQGSIYVSQNELKDNQAHIYNYNGPLNATSNEMEGGEYGVLAYANGDSLNASVSTNTLNNVTYGIVGYTTPGSSIAMEAHVNSISNSGKRAIQSYDVTAVINASCNWFGTTNQTEIDSLVEGPVSHTPWLVDGSDQSTTIGFQPLAGQCTGLPVLADSLMIVSDSSWRKSTLTTYATVNQYPWGGVNANLPATATFSLPVQLGQPYSYHSIDSVEGAKVIKSGEAITYFRKTFELNIDTGVTARIRSLMDDGMEVYVNGNLLSRESDRQKENAKNAHHDLLFLTNGSQTNGYMGGDEFDFTNLFKLDDVVHSGQNELIVVLRNGSNGDKGGFSFRMDIETDQPVAPELVESLVSNVNWRKSTYTTANSAFTFPWTGSPSLPADSTFNLPVVIGQPWSWKSTYEVEGSYPIVAEENLTYYRSTFSVTDTADVSARFRSTFDDDVEIYLNRTLLVRADDITPDNRKLPGHDILYPHNTTAINGNSGGDSFEHVLTYSLKNLLVPGENAIIVVVRNRPGDKGGFSFRMDLDQNGSPVIVKKQDATQYDPTGEPAVITVYPNPTRSDIQVELPPNEVSGTLALRDVSGKLLWHEEQQPKLDGSALQIDMSAYARGIYFLQYQAGDKYERVKIVKQ